MEEDRLKALIKRYESGQCSKAEKEMVEVLYHDYIQNAKIDLSAEQISEDLEAVYKKLPVPAPFKINSQWVRIAAILVLVGGLSLLYSRINQNPGHLTVSRKSLAVQKKEIIPHSAQSYLTLSDGSSVVLDDAPVGKLAMQDGYEIVKVKEGLIAYRNIAGKRTDHQGYNTNVLTTGKGIQYQVSLADGTNVWINAASSLKYPTSFTGSERQVELTGEGYFEVFRNVSKPFVVHTGRQNVEVLGTHFNINSYADEPAVRTTLLEGKVKVVELKTNSSAILLPGEQSVLADNTKFKVAQVNAGNTVAWKNGLFQFEDSDIQTIMRQLSRWYNVEFEIEGKVPDVKLWGEVHRNASFEKAMEVLVFFGIEYKVLNKGETRKVIIKTK
ncbi:FecR family protein [Pedobacter antarcticus]|uniref:FecR family protein n=1 Tax=Pedobacter antarcticus TaxID=34086 RepID=UPI0029309996|nr:FecR domain-containing protein [Pedobacter antarcticus]